MSSKNQYGKSRKVLTSNERKYAIQLIIELQTIRSYYVETLVMAIHIFDRFMFLVSMGHCQFDTKRLDTLVCTCLIIAAKFEQPKKPDFYNMINALIDLRGKVVSKEDIVLMEEEIVLQFGFDFNFSSTFQFMERYMQVLGMQSHEGVRKTATQLIVLQNVDEEMLNHNASEVAACSLILAINIQKMCQYVKDLHNHRKPMQDKFFKRVDGRSFSPIKKDIKERSFLLNMSMWNNKKVYYHTGYTYEMIKDCLFDFSQFIQKNLYPNKLKYFNIENIRSVKNNLNDE